MRTTVIRIDQEVWRHIIKYRYMLSIATGRDQTMSSTVKFVLGLRDWRPL
jgi:hypothetical protein